MTIPVRQRVNIDHISRQGYSGLILSTGVRLRKWDRYCSHCCSSRIITVFKKTRHERIIGLLSTKLPLVLPLKWSFSLHHDEKGKLLYCGSPNYNSLTECLGGLMLDYATWGLIDDFIENL